MNVRCVYDSISHPITVRNSRTEEISLTQQLSSTPDELNSECVHNNFINNFERVKRVVGLRFQCALGAG